MRRFVLLLLALVLLAAPLAGCAPQATPVPQVVEQTRIVEKTTVVEKVVTAAPTAVPAVTYPLDKVRISLSSKLVNMDIIGTQGQPDQATTYLASGRCFTLNPDWSTKPDLAESLTVSPDGLTATIKLREGLKYSDGTPITAEDVVYTYERQRDNKGLWFSLLFSVVANAVATDARTAVFTFTKPFPLFGYAMGHLGSSVHPKAKIESDKDYWLHPVSSGQYILKDWTPGASEWVLEENPNYWAGPSAAKRVELVAVPDMTSRVLQLTTGALDYVYDCPLAARDSFPPEVKIYSVPINGVYYVAIYGGLPADHPLMNKDVRKAISLAINRDEISQKAFFGISKPLTGFLYPGVPGAIDSLPNGGKQNIEEAKKVLATTPFASGFKFTLMTYSQRAGWTDATLVIKNNLAEIGITAEVTPLEDAVNTANFSGGKYEAGWSGNANEPLTLLRNQFVPGAFWTGAVKYNNPEMVKILDNALSATTQADSVKYIEQAQNLAAEELAYIPTTERAVLVGNRLPAVIYEGNRPPGVNVAIYLLSEVKK